MAHQSHRHQLPSKFSSKTLAKVPIRHNPEAAVAPGIRDVFAMDELSGSIVATIGFVFLVMTLTALRFEHAQRASVFAVLSWWVVIKVFRGKRRVVGAQRSYSLGAPRYSPMGKVLTH